MTESRNENAKSSTSIKSSAQPERYAEASKRSYEPAGPSAKNRPDSASDFAERSGDAEAAVAAAPIEATTRRGDQRSNPTKGPDRTSFDQEALQRHSDDGGNPARTSGGGEGFERGGGAATGNRRPEEHGETKHARGLVNAVTAAYRMLTKRMRQAWHGLRGS